ncbi:ABC transporter ATP-binding protein [Pantanalinema rosaneae CENA516]|uniref:ABC transporter ATP-binding protein n=1 Tax=Pantanalinema rosaneae TaxID=1620701 RepID=UPI003D6FA573
MSQTATQNQRSAATDTDLDVELRKVYKVFNGETAVRGVDLGIRRGEFFSILGPSGCGKTTTLRLIAGFETPSTGEILIQGQRVSNVPSYRRPVNTVFQSYALFNHLTVWDNIAFGLRLKHRGRAEIQDRVNEVLKLVKMETFAKRYPAQLSGGQQQRIALARALVNRPAVVLLDEPLGALDLKLRKEMQVELSNLHQELGLTFVMVTHDQEEALSLSDRIAVMNHGKVEQIGSPSQIYEAPQTPFVADFIGDTNLLHGKVEGAHPEMLWIVTDKGLRIKVKRSGDGHEPTSGSAVISVRPEKIRFSLTPSSEPVNCFEGRLQTVMYLGTHMHYLVELTSGDQITIMQPNVVHNPPNAETPIYISWSPLDCLALSTS